MNYPDTDNTRRIVEELRRHTDKPIEVRDLGEFAQQASLAYLANYGGSGKEYTRKIEIHLNFTKNEDVREAVFVHELLHIILRYEGFPAIAARTDQVKSLPPDAALRLERLKELFNTIIDHLHVFRRMTANFNLNFDRCFEHEVQQKANRFAKLSYPMYPKNEDYFFQVQQDILVGLEYYQYPVPYNQQILTIFRNTCPQAYYACLALREKLEHVGYSTPPLAFRCADLIRNEIIRYGHKNNARIGNQYWSLLNVVRDPRDIPLEEG